MERLPEGQHVSGFKDASGGWAPSATRTKFSVQPNETILTLITDPANSDEGKRSPQALA